MKESCPHCQADLTGEPIPEVHRSSFGGATHFSRKIGISQNDRISTWECPDCKGQWPRVEAPKPGQFRTTSVRG